MHNTGEKVLKSQRVSKAGNNSPTQEQTTKSSTGIISGPAETVAKIATALIPVPEVGLVAGGVAVVASAVSKIAALFGFFRPVATMAFEPVRLAYINMANTMGLDMGQMLSTDPANLVGQLGDEMVASPQEMDIYHIAQQPMMLDIFSFDSSQGAGTTLWQWDVSPTNVLCSNQTPSASIPMILSMDNTYLSYVSNAFKYWRGGIKLHFKFISSMFHTGRVRISWVPAPSTEVLPSYDFYHSVGAVVDLNTTSEYSCTIPYLREDPFLDSSLVQVENRPWTSGVESYSNGMIVVTVVNELSHPTDPIPPMSVLVYVSAAEDFQLAYPSVSTISNIPARQQWPWVPPVPPSSVDVPEMVYEADVEKVPFDQGSSTVEQEVTTFHDAGEEEVGGALGALEPSLRADPYYDVGIKEFLQRPLPIHYFLWGPSLPHGQSLAFDPLALFIQNPLINTKLQGFRYLRCDLEVTMRINGTKYHYGALQMSWVPLNRAMAHVTTPAVYKTFTGYKNVVATATDNSSVTLNVPFLFPLQYMDLTKTTSVVDWNPAIVNGINVRSLGAIVITPLSPLYSSTTTALPIGVTVYCAMKNIELAGFDGALRTFPRGNVTVKSDWSTPSSTIFYAAPTAAALGQRQYLAYSAVTVGQFETWSSNKIAARAEPMIPADGAIVTKEMCFGEYFSHVKQLIGRPSLWKYLTLRPQDGPVFSHFGEMHEFTGCPQLNELMNYNSTQERLLMSLQFPGFMDYFRMLYACERGSVVYKVLMSGQEGQTSSFLLAEKFQVGSAGTVVPAPLPVTPTTVTVNKNYPEAMTGSFSLLGDAASWYPYGANQLAKEVVVPYYHSKFFHFTPQMWAQPNPNFIRTVSPFTQTSPGFSFNFPTPGGANATFSITKSAGDDFQFGCLIPPLETKVWLVSRSGEA